MGKFDRFMTIHVLFISCRLHLSGKIFTKIHEAKLHLFPFHLIFAPHGIRAEWIGALDLVSFVREGQGSNPSVPNYLVRAGLVA